LLAAPKRLCRWVPSLCCRSRSIPKLSRRHTLYTLLYTPSVAPQKRRNRLQTGPCHACYTCHASKSRRRGGENIAAAFPFPSRFWDARYGLGRLVGRVENENRQCLCGLGRRYGCLPLRATPFPRRPVSP
jgi:hypothetical protein